MLKDGVIEESRSEWSAPLLIVPKKADKNGNKKWRLVIDYRQLNQRIKDDKFPLPCITEILDSLSGAVYFSHLDMSQSYYQIELDKNSRHFTAFSTERGQYQMTRLPMGLKISPSGFSRAMTFAMAGLKYENCFIYLDDLIVFGNNLINHNKNLTKVLQRLRDVNLKLNPNKCNFLRKEILYLGHIISEQGISPDPSKIKVVHEYPIPKNQDETKRFVAFANYYRKFIQNFANIAAPLNNLTRKNSEFIWTDDCQKAFETLKSKLIHPPILQYPNFSPDNNFVLTVDASGFAVGAVLSNGDGKPVAYASRSLNKAEKNYPTIHKELTSIIFGIKTFHPYLYARKFTILTDHRPLIYLFGMTNPSSRLTKFRLTLEEYDFTIKYIRGKDNVVADALSRIEITSDELKNLSSTVNETIYALTRAQAKKVNERNDLSSSTISQNRLDHPGVVELLKYPKKCQKSQSGIYELKIISEDEFNTFTKRKKYDYYIGNLIYNKKERIIYMKQDTRSTFALNASLRDLKDICIINKITELYMIKDEKCALFLNELLKNFHKWENTNIKLSVIRNVQRIDDLETRQIILNDFHMLPTGGHAGINRMYNNVRKYYFWTNLRKDVEDFVKMCNDCQRYKHSKPNIEPMSITTTATTAFQKIHLDIVGPLETDNNDNKYILTLQCDLSKFIEAYPLPNKEAETVARSFVENFILRYGVVDEIIHDQGTEFIAATMKETCKLLNIKQIKATAYHHETLGSLENSHKNLGAYLRIQTSKFPNSWSSWIPYWCFAYNNTVHTETKYTPYELVFGRLGNMPSNISQGIDPLYTFDNYPLELKYRLQNAWSDANNNLIKSKNKRKDTYDKKSKPESYSIGDKVLLKNNAGKKMEQLFTGPYEVVENKSPNIIIKIGERLVEVHKNRVKMYH